MKIWCIFLVFLSSFINYLNAQDSLKVLFLGNSYTYTNNLPQLVTNMSSDVGYKLVTDNNNIGGYTLENHLNDATSLAKIRKGNWDYVVLQEQSQIPSINYYRDNSMLPAGIRLADSIRKYNSCARIITFMTWGRRYGGQQCDPSGTYCSLAFNSFNEMQDSITASYNLLSNLIQAPIAPVGEAWRKVLSNSSYVLHTSDNSHPTLEGSYLAACTLFSSIWRIHSLGNSYTAGLSTAAVYFFQNASDVTLFNSQVISNWKADLPYINFHYSISGIRNVQFHNFSQWATKFKWDFGDNFTSFDQYPMHTYASNGNYKVKLIASRCFHRDTFERNIIIEGTLPVEFYNAKIIYAHGKPKLLWSVGTEMNVAEYIIERSTDGNNFVTITSLKATGKNEYNWIDQEAYPDKLYYRIVAKDKDSKLTFSPLLILNSNDILSALVITPNPVVGSTINLGLINVEKGKVEVAIYNCIGKEVFTRFVEYNGNKHRICVQNFYSPGIYQVFVTMHNGRKLHQTVYIK